MKKILIVIADYYEDISSSLLKSAKNNLNNFSLKIIRVPGVFEIPITISKNIKKYDGFIALGCVIKGKIKKGLAPRVRVISSNVVQNYLLTQKLPNSFNNTLNYFKKYNNCVLIFIRDANLKSVTQTLRDYKSKGFYKKGKDKLIKNYGIGAQIIKSLKIKNMILVTRSRKKVVGLDGYGIKITKQEIIK